MIMIKSDNGINEKMEIVNVTKNEINNNVMSSEKKKNSEMQLIILQQY